MNIVPLECFDNTNSFRPIFATLSIAVSAGGEVFANAISEICEGGLYRVSSTQQMCELLVPVSDCQNCLALDMAFDSRGDLLLALGEWFGGSDEIVRITGLQKAQGDRPQSGWSCAVVAKSQMIRSPSAIAIAPSGVWLPPATLISASSPTATRNRA